MSDVQIERAAERLRPAARIVWLTGAGISVASGIAPYRGGADAMWSRFVTDWGTIRRFREDPVAWWRDYWLVSHGDLLNKTFEPNAGHRAIAMLMQKRPLDVVVTQNIDGLHRAAGVPDERLIEIHGRHDRFCCTNMRCPGFRDPVRSVDLSGVAQGHAPRCAACNAHVRPLVLLFDEQYASHRAYRWDEARRAFKHADAIVFVGTSFAVGITEFALHAGRRRTLISVNTESTDDLGLDATALNMGEIVGRSEETLPALAALLG